MLKFLRSTPFMLLLLLLTACAYGLFVASYSILHGSNSLVMIGVDGELYRALIRSLLVWGGPFRATVPIPFGGLFNLSIPMNVWLDPGWQLFRLGDIAGAAAAAAFFSACYMLAAFALARQVGLGRCASAIAAQCLFALTFPPYHYGIYGQFWLNPSVALISALGVSALVLTLRMTSASFPKQIMLGAGITLVVLYSVMVESFWTTVLAVGMIPFFVPALWPTRSAEGWRPLAVYAAIGLALFASGFLTYILSLPHFMAREFFVAELPSEIQDRAYITMLWRPGDNVLPLIYLAGVAGWLAAVWLGSGACRRLGIGCLLHSAIIQTMSLLYVYTDINWGSLPLPVYVEMAGWPCYMVAAFAGYAVLWARGTPILGLQLNTMLSLLGLAVAAVAPWIVIINVSWTAISGGPSLAQWQNTANAKDAGPAAGPILSELKQLVVKPDTPFPGSVSMVLRIPDKGPVGVLNGYYAYALLHDEFSPKLGVTGLWAQGISTLDEYSQMMTPQLYYLVSRLLMRSGDYAARNWLVPSRVDTRIMPLLGVRYLITDQPDAAPGWTLRATETGRKTRHKIYLFEAPEPNLGNYSPTEVEHAQTAKQTIALLADPAFDPRRRAITADPMDAALVPAQEAEFSPVPGGFKVRAHSEGQSLLVLPIQYSHCLALETAPTATLVRVNLALLGILFDRQLSATIRNQFNFWSASCRNEDARDMKRLKVEADGYIDYPTGQHPNAIIRFSK